jgi:DNA-binding ferritin-like protein
MIARRKIDRHIAGFRSDSNARNDMLLLLKRHRAEMLETVRQLRQADLSVTDSRSFELREMFDELAEVVAEHADRIAESTAGLDLGKRGLGKAGRASHAIARRDRTGQ